MSKVSRPIPQRVGPFEVLSPKRWACVWLRTRYGLTNQQIAIELDVTVNTVATYLRSAWQHLGLDSVHQLTPLVWEEYGGAGVPANAA